MTYEHIQLDPRRPRRHAEAQPPRGAQCDDPGDGRRGARAPPRRCAPTADVRVLVVTGEGKAFSGGGDLGMLARDAGLQRRAESEGMGGPPRDFYKRYLSIHDLPIPTIAAINGHAIGAGFCFALACDIRIAIADAKMGMTFTKLGIHPGMGATYFLPRLIGTARACELLFTGRIIDARRGRAARHRRAASSPATRFPPPCATLAREIAAAAPIAVRMVKRALYRGVEHSLDDALDLESMQQSATFQTADAREGIAAVLEKREPSFAGR